MAMPDRDCAARILRIHCRQVRQITGAAWDVSSVSTAFLGVEIYVKEKEREINRKKKEQGKSETDAHH